MLIVLGGLPGTGKTTIGKALAAKLSAAYLRIDAIELALRGHLPSGQKIGPEGYAVAQAIALSNLKLGNRVVADSVNPVPESREGWREIAREAGSALLEIELVCSMRRNTGAASKAVSPTWTDMNRPTGRALQVHEYIAWTGPRLVLDTAVLGVEAAITRIEASINAMPLAESPAVPSPVR